MTKSLNSSIDFLMYYTDLTKDDIFEYVRQGRYKQLHKISIKLYVRHHENRIKQ